MRETSVACLAYNTVLHLNVNLYQFFKILSEEKTFKNINVRNNSTISTKNAFPFTKYPNGI